MIFFAFKSENFRTAVLIVLQGQGFVVFLFDNKTLCR